MSPRNTIVEDCTKVGIASRQREDVAIVAVLLLPDGLRDAQGKFVETAMFEFVLHPLGIVLLTVLHASP